MPYCFMTIKNETIILAIKFNILSAAFDFYDPPHSETW